MLIVVVANTFIFVIVMAVALVLAERAITSFTSFVRSVSASVEARGGTHDIERYLDEQA